MKRSRAYSLTLACNALFLALCAPVTAAACDTAATARPDSSCVVTPFQGRSGVWFDLATADDLRRARLLVPELRLQVEKLELMDSKRESEVADLRAAVALRREAADTLKATIEASVRDAREARQEAAEARESAGAWYRSPWLWGTTGAVLGGMLTTWLISM